MKPAPAKFLGSFLVALAVVAAAVGFTQIRQTQITYRATATIHVLPGIEAGMPVGTEVESVLKTEADMIRSEFILKSVIEKLDLNTVWGKRYNDGQILKTMESCEIAKKGLHIAALPNSALIQIEFTREDADEAVKFANAVAQAYCDYRVDRRRRIAESTASNLVEICKEPLEKLIAARTKLEATQNALAVDIRANPPQVPTGENRTLHAAQSRRNQASIEVMSRSTQLANAAKSASPDTNLIARLTADLSRFQSELAAAENAVNAESQRVEALKEYWRARENFESAERIFAPFKKAADEANAANSSSDKSPATIESRAERAATIESHDMSRGAICFGIAGVLLFVGAGQLWVSRTPTTADNQKVA